MVEDLVSRDTGLDVLGGQREGAHDAATVPASITDEHVVLRPAGEFDLYTSARLRDALLDACTRDLPVVVDLAQTLFLDLTALDLIVQARQRLRDGGHDLVVVHPRRLTRRLLALTGLEDLVVACPGP